MKWDTVKGNWTLVRRNTNLQWGNLSGYQLIKMAGKYSHLSGNKQKADDTNSQATREQLADFVGPHKEDNRRS